MNIGSWKSASWSATVMPPSDENTPCVVSIVMMSLYVVTDQYGPYGLSGHQCTGSSFRIRAK